MSTEIIVKPTKLKDPKQEDKARGLRAGMFLWKCVAAAKGQMSPPAFAAAGGLEAEAALVAWDEGRQHGFFDPVYDERKRTAASTTAPAPHEAQARRYVLCLVQALRDAGMKPGKARKFAAEELAKAGVFANAPSPKAIENWQLRQRELGPEEKLLIAKVYGQRGRDYAAIAESFIGLAATVHNVAPKVARLTG
jgi:hypothetical protein